VFAMTRLNGFETMTTALMVVLVVGIFAIQSSQSPSVDNSQTNSAHHESQTQCSSNFPNGLQLITNNDSQTKLAFEIQPGSVDQLCITYGISGDVPLADFTATLLSVNTTRLHNSKNYTTGYEYSYSPAPGVNITSNAESLDLGHLNGSRTITVLYTITALSGAVGFYTLKFPNNCPSLIPFAIADDPKGVTSADFPGFFQPGSCEASVPLHVSVTGYTGISTAWLGPTASSTSLSSSTIQA
jgi:hypothetical protein